MSSRVTALPDFLSGEGFKVGAVSTMAIMAIKQNARPSPFTGAWAGRSTVNDAARPSVPAGNMAIMAIKQNARPSPFTGAWAGRSTVNDAARPSVPAGNDDMQALLPNRLIHSSFFSTKTKRENINDSSCCRAVDMLTTPQNHWRKHRKSPKLSIEPYIGLVVDNPWITGG